MKTIFSAYSNGECEDILRYIMKYLHKMNIFELVDPHINYSKTKVVIFDVDGTLYNQNMLRLLMLKHILIYLLNHPKKYYEISIIKEFRKQRDISSRDRVDNIENAQFMWPAEKYNVSPELVKKLVNKWINEIPLGYLKICRKNGIKRLFNKIRKNNIKIAIYSDYPSYNKLNVLDLKGDLIVSSTDADIDVFKPDPKALIYITEKLNCLKSECLYVGDRQDKDGQCALSANIPYIIV